MPNACSMRRKVGRASEGCVPVSPKDRFMIVTSTAAILLAVASPAAWAQNVTQGQDQSQDQSFDQGQGLYQGQGLNWGQTRNRKKNNRDTGYGLGLRGTETSLPQTQAQQDQSALPTFGAGTLPNTGTPAGTAPPSGTTPDDSASEAPNYGRPRQKKPLLYQLPRVPPRKPPFGYPPLPPLTAYKTAPGKIRKGGAAPQADPPPPPGPTVAVLPVLPHPLPPKREEKPYDPTGIDVGSLRLFPYGEIDTGYDSNPNQLAVGVVGSSYVHGETGGKLQSQWSQNSLDADLRAGYYDFFQVPQANRPDFAANAVGRVDVTRDTKINLESHFTLTTLQPGSPLIAVPSAVFITSRPQIMTLSEVAGVSQQLNRLNLDLRGTFDRSAFGDAMQSNGTELLLSEDDFNTLSLIGRASYELNPGLIPYVQVTGDQRRYDHYFDVYGFARNSDGIDARAGAKFNITQLLTGDVSAGYVQRDYVDPRLPILATPEFNASLIYNVTPLTTFTLTAATDVSETTLANASGAVSRRLTAKVDHALLRNLKLSATATYQINRYVGTPIVEHFWTAGVGLDYSVTRDIVLRGTYTHSQLTSNFLGDYFNEDVFLVGLKLQR